MGRRVKAQYRTMTKGERRALAIRHYVALVIDDCEHSTANDDSRRERRSAIDRVYDRMVKELGE